MEGFTSWGMARRSGDVSHPVGCRGRAPVRVLDKVPQKMSKI